MNTKIGIIIAGLVVAIIIIVLVMQDSKTSPMPQDDYSAGTQTPLEMESEMEPQNIEDVTMEPMVIPASEPVEPTANPAFPTTGFEK